MKDNPDILCDKCKEFDYIINGKKEGSSFDIFVVCDHQCDNDDKKEKELEENGE